MDSSARRVYAERSRRRLPRRLRKRSMGVRIAALAGTVALAGVAIAIAVMITPSSKTDESAKATPTATPRPRGKPKPRNTGGLTPAQLAQRRTAVAELRRQGYSPLNVAEWEPKSTLRVLIGKRGDGTRWAFFFVGTHYVGHDALTPSARISVARNTEHTVTLTYTTYGPTDAACCPHGPRAKVRFLWDGSQLVPQQVVPPAYARLQSG